MRRRGQVGASGGLILVVLVLVMVGLLATYALSRFSSTEKSQSQTTSSLSAAANALDQFASTAQRLPCPADPTTATGDEVQATPSTCTFAAGTIPWKTIGLRRDDAFDAWGRKISYRVYTGAAGSLTQAGGVSTVNCDTSEAFPTAVTPVAASAGGLCQATRDTLVATFLAGKGLSLTDNGNLRNDVAYVLISHGSTGLGGYTASGARLDLPKADELGNTNAAGPFVIRAFSDVEVAADANAHFDDVIVYRTLADLTKRGDLAARNWPDDVLASVRFDQPTLTAALGSAPGADVGQQSVDFNSATVRAFVDSGGTQIGQNLSFSTAGVDGIGGVTGTTGLSSADLEGIRIDLDEKGQRFALTLNDFGVQFFLWTEQVELRFYDGNAVVYTTTKAACRADSSTTLASFSDITPGVAFNRVDIRPLPTNTIPFLGSRTSSFLISEIRSCATGISCQTTLATANPTSIC